MKMPHRVLSLLALAAAAALPALAVDGDTPQREVIVLADDPAGEHEIVDIDDLEVGQSRQASTAGGKPVTITRVEDGFDITIADKTTKIRLPADLPEAPAGAPMTKVFVEKLAKGGEQHAVVYLASDALADDAAVRARVVEILDHEPGDGDVVVHAGDGRRVKVVRVIEDETAGEGDDGEEKRDIVILRKRHVETEADAADGDDE